MKTIDIINLGRTEYLHCLEIQRETFAARNSGEVNDTFLLTEHEHVYTIGKGGDENHLLADEAELRAAGVRIIRSDRGGDITYHGPGQLVGYPVIDLGGFYPDVHRYLRDIEEILIRTIADFGVVGYREPGYTGVWACGEKIAAIGVKVSRWITMHGFALNVSTDLSFFDRIIPCGITHRGVTSLEKCTGSIHSLDDVARSCVGHFGEVFNVSPRTVGSTEWKNSGYSPQINS